MATSKLDLIARLGMSVGEAKKAVASELGTPPPQVISASADIPENSQLLSLQLRFKTDGEWYRLDVKRDVIKMLLDATKVTAYPHFEDRAVMEVCFVTMEGELCDLRYIYSYAKQQWRVE